MLALISREPREEEVVQHTSISFVDDLDGSKAAETVTFGLDGKTDEIDLNKKNAAALRKAVAAYLENGRRIRSTATGSVRSSRTSRSESDSSAIRQWAANNGIAVNARGRISTSIRERYEAAQAQA